MMRYFLGTSILCAILAMVSSAQATTAKINYTYDPIGRLTEVSYDSGQEMKYGYDPAGNIIKASNWATASETVVLPSSISVPSADSDGSFTVTWGASTTAGVTYALEEATDAAFTQTLRNAYSGSSTSTLIYGRSTGTTYYYRVKAYKEGFKDSAWRLTANGCTVTFPVVTAPGAPVINSIVAGAGSATIYFTAPSNNGGAAIVSYTATCVADGEYTRTATSTMTHITVGDLVIGVTYDCTVTATNSEYYTSAASTFVPVTLIKPNAFPWILYLPAIQNGVR
jgi:YD repeat-containing protein